MSSIPPSAPAEPHFAAIPVWLEFSGLPDDLHSIRRHAWSVFRTMVALDCARHPQAPGLVETTATDVGVRAAFDGETVLKIALGLRRRGLIKAFIPEHPDEQLFYEIAVPLPAPRTAEEIAIDLETHVGAVAARSPWRYRSGAFAAQARDEQAHRATIDLYLQHIGVGLNASVVDELAILSGRFPLAALESAFRAASQAGERHLKFVFGRLKSTRTGLKPGLRELTGRLAELHQAALAEVEPHAPSASNEKDA